VSGLKAIARGKNLGVTVIDCRRLAVFDSSRDQILIVASAEPDANIVAPGATAIQLMELAWSEIV
jgi:hypothetical protein